MADGLLKLKAKVYMKKLFSSKVYIWIWISCEKRGLEQNRAKIVLVFKWTHLAELCRKTNLHLQTRPHFKIPVFLFSLRPAHFSLSIYFQAFILMVIGLDINDAKTAKWSRAWFSSQPALNRDCCRIWLPWRWNNFSKLKSNPQSW